MAHTIMCVRTPRFTNLVERHAGFASNGLGYKGFASARITLQQYALVGTYAQRLKFLRILQELCGHAKSACISQIDIIVSCYVIRFG